MGLILIIRSNALVVELVYTCGLGPHPVKVAGSNPAKGTYIACQEHRYNINLLNFVIV